MKTGKISLLLMAGIIVYGCAAQKKLSFIQKESMTASLSLPNEPVMPSRDSLIALGQKKDTLKVVDFEGREVIIMNAIKDENGDMVATEELTAAVVTARFRNVAERHGKVDLEFQVTVPKAMQDSRWQLRFRPDMYILEDTVRLDNIIITGAEYRKAQLRGYQQYERFLSSIITDSTKFIDKWQLELFIERNIPMLYAMKSDTTFVSDEQFTSVYGVTEQEAVEHYTNVLAKRRNERRKARTGKCITDTSKLRS